tara:strand:- start:34274 stop:34519 length:246 start_codon:yes stop_codon:yes gene_type:complete
MRKIDRAETVQSDFRVAGRFSGCGLNRFSAPRHYCGCGVKRGGGNFRTQFPGDFGGALEALGVERIVFDAQLGLDPHGIGR